MNTVTISKKEYVKLKNQALAYKKMTKSLFVSLVKDPIIDVVEDFKQTGLYSRGFLKDLESGLRKSSYLKKN